MINVIPEDVWLICVRPCVIFLVLVVLLFAVRKKWKIVIPLLLLAVFLNRYYRVFAFSVMSMSASGRGQVAIMTYNIQSSSQYMKAHSDEPEEIASFILRSQADIVCLQEYNPQVCKNLQKALSGMYPYYAYLGGELNDNALFSRYPFKATPKMIVDDFGDNSPVLIMEAEIELPTGKIMVYNCHFPSNGFDRIKDANQGAFFGNDGLRKYLEGIAQGSSKRKIYSDILAEKIITNINKGVPVVACGDFNDFSRSTPLKKIENLMSDAWWDSGMGLGDTYNGHRMMHFRLDHLYYSAGMMAIGSKVKEQKYSDHHPLVVDLVVGD